VHDAFDPLLKARYAIPVIPLAHIPVGGLVVDLALRPPLARWITALCTCLAGLWLALACG
jgi:hypothetical protein